MSIKNDRWIIQQCDRPDAMIEPFDGEQRRKIWGIPSISSGLSSFGYDISLSGESFKVFSPIQSRGAEIDPKSFDDGALIEAPMVTGSSGDYFLLPPHSYALGLSVETFNMSENVLGLCVGKSTYARCGLIVNCTPLEPGWKGRLVLEFSNSADLPIRLYAGEGIAQVMFFEGETPKTTYADRAGKYQNQQGLVTARV